MYLHHQPSAGEGSGLVHETRVEHGSEEGGGALGAVWEYTSHMTFTCTYMTSCIYVHQETLYSSPIPSLCTVLSSLSLSEGRQTCTLVIALLGECVKYAHVHQ